MRRVRRLPEPQAAPEARQHGREPVFLNFHPKSFVGSPPRTLERAQPGAAPKRGARACEEERLAGARGRLPGNLAPKPPNGAVAASLQGGGGFPRRCNGRRGKGLALAAAGAPGKRGLGLASG